MTLQELITMARTYTRDTESLLYDEATITSFINQGIMKCKQYPIFRGMTLLSLKSDSPILLPEEYQYILALFASSRLYDIDERFFEGTEKRNEFEYILGSLIDDIEAGNITIKNASGDTVTNTAVATEYVTDAYFNTTSSDTESGI